MTDHRQGLALKLRNLAIDIRRAAARGDRYELPRLADLLQQPEHDALHRTLTERGVDLEELQARIDGLVEQVRRGLEEETE